MRGLAWRILVGGIITAALSQQLTDEFKAWTPWIIERIVRYAVARLPRDQQERFGEEWRSHVGEVPGEIGRIAVALGYIVAARRISFMLKTGREQVLHWDIFKRSVDVVFSFSILALISPILGLISLVLWLQGLWLQGEGGVISRSERVGVGGRSFALFKFRTAFGGQTTKIGSFLRKFRYDVLPQLMNLFRGEISLVGPRPHSLQLAEQRYQILPRYGERAKVRPGLTGWAQVRGSSEPVAELADDLYYIEHRSLRLDLLILFCTLWGGF